MNRTFDSLIVDMSTSEEKGGRNFEYFRGQKLPWLQTFLQERGIQTSSEDMGDNNGGSRPTYTFVENDRGTFKYFTK